MKVKLTYAKSEKWLRVSSASVYTRYMAEYEHHIGNVIQSEIETEDLSNLPYAQSLDQHTRVQDREPALAELVRTHPDTKLKEPVPDNELGRMLYDRVPSNEELFVDNSYNRIIRALIPTDGRRSLGEIIEHAEVTIDEVQKALDPNMIEAVRVDGDDEFIVTNQIKEAFGDDPIVGVIDIYAPPLAQHLEYIFSKQQPLPQTDDIYVLHPERQLLQGAAD